MHTSRPLGDQHLSDRSTRRNAIDDPFLRAAVRASRYGVPDQSSCLTTNDSVEQLRVRHLLYSHRTEARRERLAGRPRISGRFAKLDVKIELPVF